MSTLTEKIKNDSLDTFNAEDIVKEIVSLHSANNSNGIKELLEVYSGVEIRNRKNGTEKEALSLARDNFDAFGRIADYYSERGFEMGRRFAGCNWDDSGPVSSFCRKVTGYQAINPEWS